MIQHANHGHKSKHSPELILRILRLTEAGMAQNAIARLERMSRHRVHDIVHGRFDHIVPAHKCPSCHHRVYGGQCVACRASGALPITTSEGALELALNEEDEARRQDMWRLRMARTKAAEPPRPYRRIV